MTKWLGQFTESRDNNFNLLRFVAALLVIYSHSFALVVAGESIEPLYSQLGVTFGELAVNVFFVISGYLVLQSWQRQPSLLSFCRARVLRVIPGLAGVLLFSVILGGLFFTYLSPAAFFAEADTWKYIYKNLLLIHTEYELPGVFLGNPYAEAVNGSLWTLRYEMKMYLALAVLGVLGLLVGRGLKLFVFAYLLWYLAASLAGYWQPDMDVSAEMLRLSFCFFLGGAGGVYARYVPIRLDILIALLLVTLLSNHTPFFQFCSSLLIAYGVFYLAYIPKGGVLRFNELGDYSYGLYLYAFPIQQALVSLHSEVQATPLFLYASLLTLLCAYLSWYLIERPALVYGKSLNARHRKSVA